MEEEIETRVARREKRSGSVFGEAHGRGDAGVSSVVLLKLANIRFMNGSIMAADGSDCFDCCCGFEFRSSGGPDRAILINLF